jgi:NADPH:quinone reductase-like Zn-dependent oxidoreductase
LIKIHGTTVTSGDVRQRRGTKKSLPLWPISKFAVGIFKPKKNILGFDLAGQVEAIGKNVDKFIVGDKIFGLTGTGTYVEYRSISQEALLTQMPSNMTYEEATSIPFGASTALYFLRKANIKKGQKILINGASGSVGTFAVQLAKYFGAEVTGVCSTKNLDLVKSLGADFVVDYRKEDFTKQGKVCDIIFDTLGKSRYKDCKKILKKDGHYLLTVFGYTQIFQMLRTSLVGKRKVVCGICKETKENLKYLRELAEDGVLKPVIDQTFKLDQIRQAHTYVEKGHKKGNVVISM